MRVMCLRRERDRFDTTHLRLFARFPALSRRRARVQIGATRKVAATPLRAERRRAESDARLPGVPRVPRADSTWRTGRGDTAARP
jgi:hypothetical protein